MECAECGRCVEGVCGGMGRRIECTECGAGMCTEYKEYAESGKAKKEQTKLLIVCPIYSIVNKKI
jgi:hypothetical protein